MSILKEIEFNKVCRTCLSSSEDMKSLYATDSGLTHVCCAEMLMSFTPLKLSLNDGFPTQICSICISELNHFHTFQLKCLQSENTLRNCKDKIVHTEKTCNFEEVIIKKELPIYTDIINEFKENSIDQSCATSKSLQDPLTIAETQKESKGQELDLIKHEFIDIEIEKEDVIKTAVNKGTAKIPETNVDFLSTTRVKSLVEIYKFAIGEKPYTCTVCGSIYADEKSLALHKITHLKEKPYPCTKCSKSYTRNTSLLRHLRSHNDESSSIEIGQSCATTTSLQDPLTIAEIKNDLGQELDIKHEFIDVKIENEHDINSSSNSPLVHLLEETSTHSSLNETSERPYACTICDRGFKNKRYLNCHLDTHSGKKPYTCTVCNNSFTRKLSLKYHMLIHTGEKPYACTFCDKCFALKGQLTVHLRNHTGEKPYTCTICNSSFHQKCTLTKHLRTHTGGKKKYSCRYCNKAFESWHLLNVHLSTHAGEKLYPCSECNKLFTTKSYLKSHMLIHTGEKRYACAFCVKSFTQKSQLTIHLRTHTGERPYKCAICNHSFKHTGTLTTHLQLHSKYSCTFCDKSFARSYLLKVHLRTHTGP